MRAGNYRVKSTVDDKSGERFDLNCEKVKTNMEDGQRANIYITRLSGVDLEQLKSRRCALNNILIAIFSSCAERKVEGIAIVQKRFYDRCIIAEHAPFSR